MADGRHFGRLLNGRLGREALGLAGPLVFQALAYSLLGVLDRIMVGALAETAISGVGIGSQILFFANTLAGTVASAGAILAAQFRGAGNRDRIVELAATGSALCLALGVGSGILLWISAFPLSSWLANGNEAIAGVGAWFLKIVLLSVPAVLLTFVLTGIMRALGDTRTPVVCSLAALVTNSVLNILLINGYCGLPKWGVSGAAFATCIAHFVGFFVAVWAFFHHSFADQGFDLGGMKNISREMAIRIGRLTWPITLDALFWQAASLAYTRVVGVLGESALAAYFMFMGIRSLGYIPLGALGTASSIMAGRFLGAARFRTTRIVVGHGLRLAILGAIGMGILMCLSSWPYTWFFKVDPTVGELARRLIRWFALVLPFEGAIVVYAFVLRAGGDALAISLMTAFSFWFVGIPASWFFGVRCGYGLPGAFLGMAMESITKAFLFRCRERGGSWMRNLSR